MPSWQTIANQSRRGRASFPEPVDRSLHPDPVIIYTVILTRKKRIRRSVILHPPTHARTTTSRAHRPTSLPPQVRWRTPTIMNRLLTFRLSFAAPHHGRGYSENSDWERGRLCAGPGVPRRSVGIHRCRDGPGTGGTQPEVVVKLEHAP